MNTNEIINWRVVRQIRFREPLIAEPNNPSEPVKQLRNVRVAIEGTFLHVDPRSVDAPDLDQGDPEFSVYIVPAWAVTLIEYREPKPSKDPTANIW